MKTIENRPRARRLIAVLPAFACALALAACASDLNTQGVPQAQGASAPAGSQGTGQYPNLNLPRKGATAQFTAPEQQGAKSQLLANRQANESITPPDTTAINSDSATLSKLGQTEPNDVLKQIQSGQ